MFRRCRLGNSLFACPATGALASAANHADAGRSMIIRQLVYLDALAREKHFRRAAGPAMSHSRRFRPRSMQLEEELGVMIVEARAALPGLHQGRRGGARPCQAHPGRGRDPEGFDRGAARGRRRAHPARRDPDGDCRMIALSPRPFSARYPAVSLTVLSLTSQEIQQGSSTISSSMSG